MKQERALKSSANRQLLILALTLFGNLLRTQTLPPKHQLPVYQKRFMTILQSGSQDYSSGSTPKYLRIAYQCCTSPQFTSQIFSPLLECLLLEREPKADATLARFPIYHKRRLNFEEIPHQIQRRPQHAIFPPHCVPQSTSMFTSYASAAAASAGQGAQFPPTLSPSMPVIQECVTFQQLPHSQAMLVEDSSHFNPDTMQGTFPTPVPSYPSSANILPTMIHIGDEPAVPPQQSETDPLQSLQATTNVESMQITDEHLVQPYSFESQPSDSGTMASSTVLQQPDTDEPIDKLSLNGTHTQSDRPIEMSNEQEEFGMQGGLSESGNDSYSEHTEYDQIDEDEIRIFSHDQPVPVKKAIKVVDNSLADENFCTACRVRLRTETKSDEQLLTGETEDAEETGLDDEEAPADVVEVDKSLETYHSHIESESHKENVIMCQKFTSELQWHYEPLMEDLIKILEQLEGEVDGDPVFAKLVDEIKDEKENMETKVEDLKSNSPWRDAIGGITEMADKIQSLLSRASATRKQEHELAAEPMPPDPTATKVEESDEEQEEDLKPTPEVHVQVLSSRKFGELRTLEQKLHSRQKKIRRGRGGHK